jgi:hypothetical protein
MIEVLADPFWASFIAFNLGLLVLIVAMEHGSRVGEPL